MYYGLCSIRLIADVALLLAFPVLIARIIIRGNAGVSLTSQVLHLLVFLFRYSDLNLGTLYAFFDPSFPSWKIKFAYLWTPTTKGYLICAAFSVLVAMGYRAVKDKQFQSWTFTRQAAVASAKAYALYLLPALLLGYRFNYASFSWVSYHGSYATPAASAEHNLVTLISEYFSPRDLLNINTLDAREVAWATSIFLAAIADIPQYKKYYRYVKDRIDWWLMSFMALIASWRLLYFIHWIARYVEEHHFDPIAVVGGVIQVFAFWMFFVLVVNKVNDTLSEGVLDLEAQLASYDSERWGEENGQVLFEVKDEK